MNRFVLFGFMLFLVLLPFAGCIDNTVQAGEPTQLTNTAQLLRYIEDQGDFANTENAPGLVSASELLPTLEQSALLDIRPLDQFTAGHIAKSVRVTSQSIYQVVDSIYSQNTAKKIVIISKNGQPAAYYTCLLRLAGFKSVCCLKYGMAAWNQIFADEWLSACKEHEELKSFTNIVYDKDPSHPLPDIMLPAAGASMDENFKQRIKTIIGKGFATGENFLDSIEVQTQDKKYIVCYCSLGLYSAGKLLPDADFSHLPYTRWYRDYPAFDFRSVNFLQTLPPDREILIYTTNGLLSACMCAYLTVLGYNVKTLLFGANQLFYPRLTATATLVGDAFSGKDIMNYPYTSGGG